MARETRAIWAARVARWHESGLNAATFARRERCNPRSLTYWRWRLAKAKTVLPARGIPPRAVSFVEVVAPASTSARDVPVEVVLPAGYRLRLSAAVTPDLLQTVLAALEASR
jgi:hypothetical protein